MKTKTALIASTIIAATSLTGCATVNTVVDSLNIGYSNEYCDPSMVSELIDFDYIGPVSSPSGGFCKLSFNHTTELWSSLSHEGNEALFAEMLATGIDPQLLWSNSVRASDFLLNVIDNEYLDTGADGKTSTDWFSKYARNYNHTDNFIATLDENRKYTETNPEIITNAPLMPRLNGTRIAGSDLKLEYVVPNIGPNGDYFPSYGFSGQVLYNSNQEVHDWFKAKSDEQGTTWDVKPEDGFVRVYYGITIGVQENDVLYADLLYSVGGPEAFPNFPG